MIKYPVGFKLIGGNMTCKVKFLIFIVITLMLFSCGTKNNTKGIDFELTISPKIVSYDNADVLTLTDKLYIKMNFKYSLNEKFNTLADDYIVFVHFWRKKQDKMLLNFDHSLKSQGVKETSSWKQGDVIKYSQKVYIPKFLDDYDAEFDGFEKINLTIGLHKPNSSNGKIILFHKELRVEAEESHAPAINYQDGWHDIETNPKGKKNYRKWQWTKGKATCIIDNKNYESSNPKNYSLIIRGGVSKDILKDQSVIFKINGKEIDKFIPKGEFFDKEYTITPAQMGTDYMFTLTITTDMFFMPSKLDPDSKDNRELGMQIYYIYFRESIK